MRRPRAPAGETLGFSLPSGEFCQQVFCVCALCESVGLCAFCRLHCWCGGCVGNFCIDHLHISAEISDLLRQSRDVRLQILNVSSRLQRDLGPIRSAEAEHDTNPLWSASTAESFRRTISSLMKTLSLTMGSAAKLPASTRVGCGPCRPSRPKKRHKSFLQLPHQHAKLHQMAGPESFFFVRARQRSARWRWLALATPIPNLASNTEYFLGHKSVNDPEVVLIRDLPSFGIALPVRLDVSDVCRHKIRSTKFCWTLFSKSTRNLSSNLFFNCMTPSLLINSYACASGMEWSSTVQLACWK